MDKTDNTDRKGKLTIRDLIKAGYKCSDLVISDLKNAFTKDYTIERACRYAGINIDTYYDWRMKSEEFAAVMDRCQDHLVNAAQDIISNKIEEDKDNEMAVWVLERRDKKRYSPRSEVTGPEGESILPDKPLSLEQAKQVYEIINGKENTTAGV